MSPYKAAALSPEATPPVDRSSTASRSFHVGAALTVNR